jgi:hypothetical protein
VNKGHLINGMYVPEKSKYKFKDKENNIIPPNLDTVNIYREVATYLYGNLTKEQDSWFYFLKFYPKGRVLKAKTWRDQPEILQKSYKDVSFITEVNRAHCYYYSKDGKKLQIEIFRSIGSSGIFDTNNNYYLNATGDTLTQWERDGAYKAVYVKEKIPRVFEDYTVNW